MIHRLFASLTIASVALPLAAHAVPTNYVFDGATVDINNTSYLLTGSFIFDPATNRQFPNSLTLSGPAPYGGILSTDTDQFPSGQCGPNTPVCQNDFLIETTTPLPNIPTILLFETFLTSVSEDPLVEVNNYPATGFAVPEGPANVPEPGSLVLLIAPLVFLGFALYRRFLFAKLLVSDTQPAPDIVHIAA